MKNKLDEKMHIYSSSYVNKHNLLGLIVLIKILYRIFVFSDIGSSMNFSPKNLEHKAVVHKYLLIYIFKRI